MSSESFVNTAITNASPLVGDTLSSVNIAPNVARAIDVLWQDLFLDSSADLFVVKQGADWATGITIRDLMSEARHSDGNDGFPRGSSYREVLGGYALIQVDFVNQKEAANFNTAQDYLLEKFKSLGLTIVENASRKAIAEYNRNGTPIIRVNNPSDTFIITDGQLRASWHHYTPGGEAREFDLRILFAAYLNVNVVFTEPDFQDHLRHQTFVIKIQPIYLDPDVVVMNSKNATLEDVTVEQRSLKINNDNNENGNSEDCGCN